MMMMTRTTTRSLPDDEIGRFQIDVVGFFNVLLYLQF
jgi:hypothetical protein